MNGTQVSGRVAVRILGKGYLVVSRDGLLNWTLDAPWHKGLHRAEGGYVFVSPGGVYEFYELVLENLGILWLDTDEDVDWTDEVGLGERMDNGLRALIKMADEEGTDVFDALCDRAHSLSSSVWR